MFAKAAGAALALIGLVALFAGNQFVLASPINVEREPITETCSSPPFESILIFDFAKNIQVICFTICESQEHREQLTLYRNCMIDLLIKKDINNIFNTLPINLESLRSYFEDRASCKIFYFVCRRRSVVFNGYNNISRFPSIMEGQIYFRKANIGADLFLGVLPRLFNGNNCSIGSSFCLVQCVSHKQYTDEGKNYRYKPDASRNDDGAIRPISHRFLGIQILFGALGLAIGLYLQFKAIESFLRFAEPQAVALKFILSTLLCIGSGIIFVRAVVLLTGP
ncbi:hypothetical protein SAMN06265365_101652 [Tistlia consotensis]|uniref:Uncharacterized protein n=1 Tax=Tistlia consotensis USBA 355 TaxID=560819 RepID=A0A1Y6B7G1_9PROT|nr:hypothetical protein SAMN05428998_101651 [Tistlia consotensis USBA 355]SNR29118.1 hypothetical protein SAMN06265365_101652 [Tistlia consotensis]